LNALYSIEGINTGIVRRYGEKLLEIMLGEPDLADLEAMPEALDKKGKAVISQCREVLEAKAAELGLAVEVLARKKDLEHLVRSALDGRPTLPERLINSWRYPEIGEDLLNAVAPKELNHV
jgi:ribonuclease D